MLLLASRQISAQFPGVDKGAKAGKRSVLPPNGKAKAKQAKQQAILERFLQMSPAERRRALAQLPPDRREQILRRLNALELLSDNERHMLRGRFEAFADLAPDRRQAVRQELQQLRRLTPAERAERLASAVLREKFSDEELRLLEEVADGP
jgi:hypothetical protein